MLDIEYPIIQAGMGSFADPPLVAAVSNAGAMGCLGAASYTPDSLRAAIREIRRMTDKPFAVDVEFPGMVEVTGETRDEMRELSLPKEHIEFVNKLKKDLQIPDVPAARTGEHWKQEGLIEMAKVCLEERVPVIAVALGRVGWLGPEARALGIKMIGMAGNVRAARNHAADNVDIIVAQGHDAGGHTGRIGTMNLIPQVVDAVRPIPVLGAGGIGDGRGLVAALALGAAGVWCGTAFLLTPEATMTDVQRDKIMKASERDAIISKAWTGKTMRQIANPITEAWEDPPVPPLKWPLQLMLMDDIITSIVEEKILDLEMVPCGQISGMLNEVRSAKQVVDDMVESAVRVLEETFPGEVQTG
jgi:NAD(P)H-dependent flavin oxidoreductase YrpB (nitropropane dioxygenase family)